MHHNPDTVLSFWFDEITPNQWWDKSPDFDKVIDHNFGALHAAAVACELFEWRETTLGLLAEVVVLERSENGMNREGIPKSAVS